MNFKDVNRGVKVRVYPDDNQEDLFKQNIGCVRLVYNHILSEMIYDYKIAKQYHTGPVNLNNRKYCNMKLTNLKRNVNYGFLYDVESSSLQSAFNNLIQAMKNYFSGRTNFPYFKSKKNDDKLSFRIINNNNVKTSKNKLKIAKYGWIKCKGLRKITGKILSVTISHVGDKWFASINYKNSIGTEFKKTNKSVGVDLGIKNLLTLSNGEVKAKLQLKKLEEKIKKEQRKLSRKIKNSNNWMKNKKRIQEAHLKMKNTRKDYIHKITTELIQKYDEIVIENIKSQNLMKRTPLGEKNKSTLSKNIGHSAWHEIKKQLKYKAQWYGKQIIEVDPRNTSKKCHKCGHTNQKLKLADRIWTCDKCKTLHDRDINAAKNILKKGHKKICTVGETGIQACITIVHKNHLNKKNQ
ncbi:RNA-guided endonuclease InsQ/TnpB family protein [Methanobrevibacter sp. DSM 116169]|uniref:RNA-guided endonuclease InsQ/TnpB family protein n=1 Tax=Methanobrevibacter sp. DSM 116169 TaxID=3242727 RepID=UPI0038FC5385